MDDKIVSLYKGKVKIKYSDSSHGYWLVSAKPVRRLTGVTTHLGVLDKPALIPWAVGLTVDFIREHMDLLNTDDAEKILKLAKDESGKQRDLAAEIGTAIHNWIEAHIQGHKPGMPDDPKVLRGVNAFLDWVDEYKVQFEWAERILYSQKHDYVGRGDMGIRIGVKPYKRGLYLGDTKTANNIYPEVKAQTAAYLKADEEESGTEYDGRWVLRISKETEEEYTARMEKKVAAGKLGSIPPYKVFEAVFLDSDPKSLKRDFDGYIACKSAYDWLKLAGKELSAARKD